MIFKMFINRLRNTYCQSFLDGGICYIIRSRSLSTQRDTKGQNRVPGNEFEYIILQEPRPDRDQMKQMNGSNIAVRRIGLLDLAKSKLYEAQFFYDEFSGMSEVKVAQNKVIEIQNQLQLVQERRRHILLELTLIRKQLQDLHVEVQKTVRGEHRYVELIKEEFEVLAREKEKNQIFQIVDQEERDLFSHLTSAVKTSHEKERTQANNVKYWSIIGSCVGALLGIIATSINYYYRNTQFEAIKQTTGESVTRLVGVDEKLDGLNVTLDYIKEYVTMRKLEEDRLRILAQSGAVEEEKQLKPLESWSDYLKRNTIRIYRFFMPITNK
ncbi:mitochondrial potassium channel-like [Toxorhynchites rutilus septentrionalis]|uniref:mitochondrial potassium channel-like n=1 Tax=Toxorhynchites rutilus septentrionalis TaxID=329112 RepID=UPI00247942E9|nr:mitochondrial potassium channel-like [Toxorhynchites rutilus septentrionalis]